VIRKRISVGVAYDSPTRSVAASIHRVLAGLEAVRREPAPIVKFADFGASALIFEVYFWVDIADWWKTETELRHQISETFAAEKIVLAFPQSDVHLETTTPLQVVIRRCDQAAPGQTE
jgi:small-conductance mechanosensitive channel